MICSPALLVCFGSYFEGRIADDIRQFIPNLPAKLFLLRPPTPVCAIS
jgi:hypothetical protein